MSFEAGTLGLLPLAVDPDGDVLVGHLLGQLPRQRGRLDARGRERLLGGVRLLVVVVGDEGHLLEHLGLHAETGLVPNRPVEELHSTRKPIADPRVVVGAAHAGGVRARAWVRARRVLQTLWCKFEQKQARDSWHAAFCKHFGASLHKSKRVACGTPFWGGGGGGLGGGVGVRVQRKINPLSRHRAATVATASCKCHARWLGWGTRASRSSAVSRRCRSGRGSWRTRAGRRARVWTRSDTSVTCGCRYCIAKGASCARLGCGAARAPSSPRICSIRTRGVVAANRVAGDDGEVHELRHRDRRDVLRVTVGPEAAGASSSSARS